MKFKAIVLAVLAAVLFSGCCVLFPLPASKYQSRYGIIFRGELVTEEKAKQVDQILSELPPVVIESVRSISVREYNDPHMGDNLGHCMFTRDICIACEGGCDECLEHVILHESTHAYMYRLLSSRSNLEKAWLEIAGDIYRSRNKEKPFCLSFPKDGALSGYGATKWQEDIAETNAYIHSVVNGRKIEFFNYNNRPRFIADRRFRKKLDFLLKYGFMSEETYKKFLALKYY